MFLFTSGDLGLVIFLLVLVSRIWSYLRHWYVVHEDWLTVPQLAFARSFWKRSNSRRSSRASNSFQRISNSSPMTRTTLRTPSTTATTSTGFGHSASYKHLHSYYARPPGGSIKRWCCLTSVCLSRTSGLSREQRGLGRLKLAHVTSRYMHSK